MSPATSAPAASSMQNPIQSLVPVFVFSWVYAVWTPEASPPYRFEYDQYVPTLSVAPVMKAVPSITPDPSVSMAMLYVGSVAVAAVVRLNVISLTHTFCANGFWKYVVVCSTPAVTVLAYVRHSPGAR